MTTLNEITYVDWQLKLNEIGSVSEGIEDINQCIAIILSTQKGSVPHRPTFGSDILKYVDYPINSAKANIIRETVDAITLWETRVNVDSVSVEIIAKVSGKLTEIGAVQNRLESIMESQEVQKTALTSANSLIKDADIAEESANYVKNQILQQTTASLLATANQSPSIALQLV